MFLDDEITLENCPEKFALNCKNYKIGCHKCKANGQGKFLKYLPIDKSITNHPANIKQKAGNTSYSRKGRYEEKKLIEKDKNLTSTYGSGMVGGDGDAYLDLGTHKLRVEIKTRFTENSSKSYTPTAKELKEGNAQNIKVWFITINKKNNKFIYIDAKTFYEILKFVIFHKDVSIFEQDEKDGSQKSFTAIITAADRGVEKGHLTSIYFNFMHFNLTRGTKPPITKIGCTNTFNSVFNPYGSYIISNYNLFNDLLNMYKYLLME